MAILERKSTDARVEVIDCAIEGYTEPCGECTACVLENLDPNEPIPFAITYKADLYFGW